MDKNNDGKKVEEIAPYRYKTRGTEAYLGLTDDVVNSEYSAIAEERFVLLGRFKSGEVTEIEFLNCNRELDARSRKLMTSAQLAQSKEKFDHMVMAGIFVDRRQNAIQAYNRVYAPFCKMMEKADLEQIGVADGQILSNPAAGRTDIPAKDVVNMWQAAAMPMKTDSAQSEEDFTDLMVHYVEQPLTLLNVINKRTISEMDIREFREDSAKVEGKPAAIEEGTRLPLTDFGTKDDTRALTTVGARVQYTLMMANDSNRRHFMPYLNARLWEKHFLEVEKAVVKGDGNTNNPTGILTESGVVTNTAVASGAWTQSKVNSGFVTPMKTVIKNAYKPATHVIVHPSLYYDLISLGTDTEGWFLQSPVSVNAPIGANMATIFNVPLIQSFALLEGEYIVANMDNTLVYCNGAIAQRQEGTDGTDLSTLTRTIILYCWLNQYTRFPNHIVKGTKTA